VNGFPGKVLLASDGLESSALAARAAVDLAKGGGAELHVVHVWHTVPSPHYDHLIGADSKMPGVRSSRRR
jgi:nucleotide-binding universal stress UspA family protein